MPELKHAFSAGRMNKDLDERLVPNGEYRDATNIEISTSEGSNTGVAQSLRGNLARRVMAPHANANYDLGTNDNIATCVGSVSSPDTDKIYYLVNSQINVNTGADLTVKKNYILEYDTVRETIKYVFVDIFYVLGTISTANVNNTNVLYIAEGSDTGGVNQTGIRVGMKFATQTVTTYTEQMGIVVTDISWDSGVSRWKITLSDNITLNNGTAITFTADSVLEFNPSTLITGINILDEFLFFTDNKTEPKKINIKRSILGTGGTQYLNNAGNGGINGASNNADSSTFNGENAYFHTRLVIDNWQNATPDYMVVTNDAGNEVQYVDLSHITVIRKAPPTPLSLDMYRTSSNRVNPITGVENAVSTTASNGTANFTSTADGVVSILEPGQVLENVFFDSEVDFRENDVLLFAGQSALLNDLEDSFTENARDVRVKVVAPAPPEGPIITNTGPYFLEILSIKDTVASTDGSEDAPWIVRLEDKDPLFNFKFPRFSYRYKYEDGEYSAFAPWSEVAFLTSYFDYQPKKGHNLGMMNQMRGLKIKGYHPTNESFPRDVVEIDILYKETNKPTVYTVKTITPKDGFPLWPNDQENASSTGEFELTTDMIHTVVPANQLIRPFDNVPRKALAQDISANRLIYGNYLQNYNVHKIPDISISVESEDYAGQDFAAPSVKTMRDYQVGVVFSDEYGRETPVLTSKQSSIRVPKSLSAHRNRLNVSLSDFSEIPDWARYYSFYIKETSVEYYTLSMDRWYNAADGNIWLSFPSADRNKLMEEDFLILKKAHGDDRVVYEKAKYRILAIENDAPDFIKTRKLSLGTLLNNSDVETGNNVIAPQNIGFPLPGTREIICSYIPWKEVFGDQMHITQPDKLFGRIFSPNGTSAFYKITRVAYYEQGETIKLTFDIPFGEDMGITSTDGTVNNVVDGLSFEIIEEKVLNQPEFDGRFFVKIYKDDVLSQYVASMDTDDWFVTHAFDLGYINNHGYVNAGMRRAAGSTAPTGNPVGFDGVCPYNPVYASNVVNDGSNTVEWSHNTNATVSNDLTWKRHYTSWKFDHALKHPTEHDWSGLLNYSASSYNTGQQYEFLGGNAGSSYYADIREAMSYCSIRAINGVTWVMEIESMNGSSGSDSVIDAFGSGHPLSGDDFRQSAQKFWKEQKHKNRFFIDACTAYQLAPGVRDLPGSRFPSTHLSYNYGDGVSFGPVAGQNQGTESVGNNAWGPEGFKTKWGIQSTSLSGPNSGYDLPGGFMAHGPGNFFEEGPYAAYLATGAGGYASNVKQCGNDEVFPNWATYSGIMVQTPNVKQLSFGYVEDALGNQSDIKDTEEYWNWITRGDDVVWGSGNDGGSKGTPSRGIYTINGRSAMDISWCSFHQDNWESTGVSFQKVEDMIGSTLGEYAWNFIQALVAPGSKFRFRRDPDQTVYTVLPFTQPYTSEGYDNSRYFHSSLTDVYCGTYGIRNHVPTEGQEWGIFDIPPGALWKPDTSIYDAGTFDNDFTNYNELWEEDGMGSYATPFSGSIGDEVANENCLNLFQPHNKRQRWTIIVEPNIGSGPSGYNPIHGTDPELINDVLDPNWRRALQHDNKGIPDAIEVLSPFSNQESVYSEDPGIWETEPREAAELDIYWQASRLIPIHLNRKTIEQYAPIGSTITLSGYTQNIGTIGEVGGGTSSYISSGQTTLTVTGYSNPTSTSNGFYGINFDGQIPYATMQGNEVSGTAVTANMVLDITLSNNTTSTIVVAANVDGGTYNPTILVYGNNAENAGVDTALYSQNHVLGWNNCWCFGNGVESDRIRDDFNAPQMDNGVKASATLENRDVEEEHKKYGMIWSDIYNSISGINNTNQFIAGEKITKDINPSHGSIQALKTRDTRLTIFCEDKVLKAVTNRDALYNADGNPQLVASNAVVGDVTTYLGDYGISTNPESLVVTPTNMYFTDVMRGKVLVLSGEGVRPISDAGMKDYFADTMNRYVYRSIGTYDERKNEYNITLQKKHNVNQLLPYEVTTLSYSEKSKGWPSFKSFQRTIQAANPTMVRSLEGGETLNNKYYTFYGGHIWQHHFTPVDEDVDNGVNYNFFYGYQNYSDITMLFNDVPEEVKSFGVINYEGSQARITAWDADDVDDIGFYNNDITTNSGTANVGTILTNNVSDGEYYNLTAKTGWYMENLATNLQTCGEVEFKDKEGKYYGYPTGEATSLSNLDEQEFSVQGLGIATVTHDTPTYNGPITLTLANNTSTTYNPDTEIDGNTDGAADGVWDSTAD